MKNIIFIIIGVIIGVGALFFFGPTTQQEEQTQLTGPISYNCELSGGAFTNGECVCPIASFQTQDEMYDKETGFCQSDVGGPAGDAFNASIGLPWGEYSYWNQIIVKLCEESDGEISGIACICPLEKTYDKTTGQCR
ncbi:MAG: hypothetical protein WC702_04830 [Patescibacteria group bacterium]|jgi:hypothetical protein